MDLLELGLTLSTNHGPCLSCESITSDNYYNTTKKRRSDEAFDDRNRVQFTTLPLFRMSLKNDPNEEEEDDEYKELDKNSSTTNNDGASDDDEGVIGWPPINIWRKKICRGILDRENNACDNGNDNGEIDNCLVVNSKSKYIKVTMEGVGIGRKVDLRLHHSYHTLAQSLLAMFEKDDQEHVKDYEVTYQDIDGDWLLAGDVPWSTFIGTAQRLKLLRSTV